MQPLFCLTECCGLTAGDMFLNARNGYHITLFHTSGLLDPVTDPMQPSGGFPASLLPCDRPVSTPDTLEAERTQLEMLAAQTQPPTLEAKPFCLSPPLCSLHVP